MKFKGNKQVKQERGPSKPMLIIYCGRMLSQSSAPEVKKDKKDKSCYS